jgi:hypothetical protein
MSLKEKIIKIIENSWGTMNLDSDNEKTADKILSLISKELISKLPNGYKEEKWMLGMHEGYNQSLKDCKEVIIKTLK